jgi:DMSO/TMAO reductase YedYZ heme-binding membrane subunit
MTVHSQVWWHLARASGLVAWALVTASVVWGLVLAGRLTGKSPTPRWNLDLHRFLGGLAVTFTVVHILGLVADSYVHIGWSDVLVPFASSWKPGAVAWGVVGLYLIAAVETTSLLMRRLPRRLWRAVHSTSFGLFGVATVHAFTAGTDTGNPLVVGTAMLVGLGAIPVLIKRATVPARQRRERELRRVPT